MSARNSGKLLITRPIVIRPCMACRLQILALVRVKTVQLAIQDPELAHSIRNLLLQDGRHQVHLVDLPDLTVAGVILIEAVHLRNFPSLTNQPERLVVIVHRERDDLSKIWDAGVRHVLFHGDSPQAACTKVLGVELAMAPREASAP